MKITLEALMKGDVGAAAAAGINVETLKSDGFMMSFDKQITENDLAAADKIRACMKPFREKLIDFIFDKIE